MKLDWISKLRYFDSASRHESFVKAARELHVTQGAVSRQIRDLEDELGVVLFERRNRAVHLTAEGKALRIATVRALQDLITTVEDIRASGRENELLVSCEPTISMQWLMPRLVKLYQEHPQLQLRLHAAGGPIDFSRTGVHAALRRNDFRWSAEIEAEHLCDEWIAPVCSPSLLTGNQLRTETVTRLHTASRLESWESWENSWPDRLHWRGDAHYEHFYFTIQAAVSGLGIAIASALMVQQEITTGRLVAPFGFRRDASAYYMLSRSHLQDERTAILLSWLRRETTETISCVISCLV